MNLSATLDLARQDKLYPSVILHGGAEEDRREAALELGRILLCDGASRGDGRPCGRCRHCKRIVWPEKSSEAFHPDFRILERDLRTATSVEATRNFLRGAHVTPFEAAGQVFVVANAETLSGEAANALLKILEESPGKTARHFLLLAPSQFDLLPTLRSRSLSLFLGAAARPRGEDVSQTAEEFGRALDGYLNSRHAGELLAAAGALQSLSNWDDPRARAPWERAAAAILDCAASRTDSPTRAALLALATDLLEAPRLRLRGIPANRILEGTVCDRLSSLTGSPS